MDKTDNNEDVKYIFQKGKEGNDKNNPFGSITIFTSILLNEIKRNCENEITYEIALNEVKNEESIKGILDAYNISLEMANNSEFLNWIKKQQISNYELEVFIFLKSLDGLMVNEIEKKYWDKGRLSQNFKNLANDTNNFLNFQNRSFSDFKIFSTKNNKNESLSLKNSPRLRDALIESFEPIKQLDEVLINNGDPPIGQNHVDLYEALGNVDWGSPGNSFSGLIFHSIFKELQNIHSSKRVRAAMALHELLLLFFPSQFTTAEEWESLKKESAANNQSYKQHVEREVLQFINFKK